MNTIINTAAAQHLDDAAKEQARDASSQAENIHNQRVKCRCTEYKSPYENCPNCGPEYWESQTKKKNNYE